MIHWIYSKNKQQDKLSEIRHFSIWVEIAKNSSIDPLMEKRAGHKTEMGVNKEEMYRYITFFSYFCIWSLWTCSMNVVYKIGVWPTARVGSTSGNRLPPFLDFFPMIWHRGKPPQAPVGNRDYIFLRLSSPKGWRERGKSDLGSRMKNKPGTLGIVSLHG